MAELPKPFGQPTEALNTTFNFVEITSGLGYAVFYGFSSIDDTTRDYHLSTNQVYSETIESDVSTGTGASYSLVQDLDFDSAPFEITQTISGDVFINITHGVSDFQSGGASTDGYCIVRVRKWDGSTETEIADVQTSTRSQAGLDTEDFITDLVKVNVSDQIFNKGDTLRITVEQYARSNNATAGRAVIGIDPKNREGETYLTSANNADSRSLDILVPIKIPL